MTTQQEDQAYERGRSDGEVRERLASHDRHFQAINGQLEQVAKTLSELTLVVSQGNARQQAILDMGTATREAVRAADARRWTRWQRVFAVVGVLAGLATIIGVYIAWRALTGAR